MCLFRRILILFINTLINIWKNSMGLIFSLIILKIEIILATKLDIMTHVNDTIITLNIQFFKNLNI
uniref:Uncharacterized protein n=1 Tax=Moumouvirus sp. 'Monve' TaxID=1128131 RepID=H2EF90_9VIRU|nr:hypothetical protein mv_R953 [Moumouvirus Monve]